MYAEKRHFHRVAHDARATLTSAGRAWSCLVEDLSLNGCLVDLTEPRLLDPGQIYHLSIQLTYAIRIEMDVALAHLAGNHAGFRCVSIDSDSIGQLRRLIELNLGDSRLLERDMRELIRG
ncbi:PilZ domain-containing protein [Parasulfuritortus cantonensis]|uniref:Cyclic diguanosine monophosphate-binding protein n=1 Tax=Parasulfuritortus cantonensis TaxID=2528202 RepID=A0A4R1BE52_9PROT|nr:PilZ domain-containing protein [Parasulfuritortus cantonensis]TCJ15337.1 PilZ domain-containing protein [Parasulfuritortus cantonensis]